MWTFSEEEGHKDMAPMQIFSTVSLTVTEFVREQPKLDISFSLSALININIHQVSVHKTSEYLFYGFMSNHDESDF